MHRLMASKKAMLLLLRDPSDIAISRTFRKPEYRSRFNEMQASEFMLHNINYVKNFSSKISESSPDLTVKFEEMKNDLEAVIRHVSNTLGIDTDQSLISQTVKELAYMDRKNAAKKMSKTNVYTGPKVDLPDEINIRVQEELGDIRSQLGYSS